MVEERGNAPIWLLKAFRYALDPSASQETALFRYAGSARWAFNHALAAKVAAHERCVGVTPAE